MPYRIHADSVYRKISPPDQDCVAYIRNIIERAQIQSCSILYANILYAEANVSKLTTAFRKYEGFENPCDKQADW